MMETKTKSFRCLLSLLSAMFLLSGLTACSSSGDDPGGEPVIEIGDVVKNPTQVRQYENTKKFQSDLDALVTYAIDLQTFRLYYWALLSNGFENGEAFCSTPEYINGENGAYLAETMFTIIDEIVQNAEQYEGAIENLHNSGVISDPTAQTRGFVADGVDFILQCRKTQVMGRNSVMTILRQSNMATDTQKLKELFDSLPSELRAGYKDYSIFWNHFSAGKLDSKANQIFVNLYNYNMDFTAEAQNLKITPGKNMVIAGTKLMESGVNLLIDASPNSNLLNYGKDLYGTINSTGELITKGDVKGFLQQAFNNAANYGPLLYNGLKLGEWESPDLFGKDWDLALALETVLIGANEQIFTNTFEECFPADKRGILIPNLVACKDENGKEVLLVCMVDSKTGTITVGFSMDKDGNIVMNPKTPGTKQITVVGRNGKRKTKTVIVPDDRPTELLVDLDEETLLEDDPANGYLELRPSGYLDELGTSGTYEVFVITNYLYYSCKTEDDWLSASVASDMNVLKVRMAENDTGKERKGSVTVVATNQKGEVKKRAVFTLRQMPKQQEEGSVWTTPTSLAFNADGGIQELEVGHSFAYPVIGCNYSSGMEGWTKISWKETSSGYNIVVDASANNTDQERSGTITVYAAVSQDALNNVLDGGKADPELVVSTTVLVKQEPAGAVSGEIESIDFKIDVAQVWDDGRDDNHGYSNSGTLSAKDGTIKTTMKGDGMHVECAQTIKYTNVTIQKVYDVTVSFDIDDVSAIESKKAKIVNLKYHANVQVTYLTNYDDDYNEVEYHLQGKGTEEEGIEVTNLPMSGASTWSGTAGDGVKFSNLINKDYVEWYNYSGSVTSTTSKSSSLVDSPSNNVNVTIHFK